MMNSLPHIPLHDRRYRVEAFIGGKWRRVRSTKTVGGGPRFGRFRIVRGRRKRNRATFDIKGLRNVMAWKQKRRRVKRLRVKMLHPFPNLTLDIGTGWPRYSLARKLQVVGHRLKRKLMIREGTRTRAQQTAFWNAYVSRGYAPPAAARPGTSNHEARNGETYGRAADVGVQSPGAPKYDRGVNLAAYPRGAAEAYRAGLAFPVRGEDWHTEER